MARLGWPESLATPCSLHQRRASLEVDVLPLERAHLAGTHPGLSPEPEHRGGVGTHCCPGPVQECPQLWPREGVDLVDTWGQAELDLIHGVGRDQLHLHRTLQDQPESQEPRP
jgi:hypothetical protein